MSITKDFRPLWLRNLRRNQIRERAVLGITRARNKVGADALTLLYPKSVSFLVVKCPAYDLVAIYVYTSIYSTIFTVSLSKLYRLRFYPDANAVKLLFNGRHPFTSLGFSHLYRLTKMFHTLFVCRLRVRGRLYRIYKRNIYRDIQYRFGHTHKMMVYTEGIYVRYIRKKRIRLFSYDYKYIVDKCREIRDVFPLNIYTRRGIRVGGERTYTRIGKTVKYY